MAKKKAKSKKAKKKTAPSKKKTSTFGHILYDAFFYHAQGCDYSLSKSH